MKITRKLDFEDVLAFNTFSAERYETYRKAIRTDRIATIALMALISLSGVIVSLQYIPPLIAGMIGLISFVIALTVAELVNSAVRKRRMRRFVSESLTPELLAESFYTIAAEGLSCANPYGGGNLA